MSQPDGKKPRRKAAGRADGPRQGRKRETHRKILDAAGRLFAAQGFAATGVDQVMAGAGLTHGGFYAHFRNKQALLTEVVAEMAETRQQIREEGLGDCRGWDWVQGMVARYLSPGHREAVAQGCLVPPLVSEVGRSSPETRRAFEKGLRRIARRMARQAGGSEPRNEGIDERMLSLLILCFGGMAVSRAVRSPEVARRVLDSARQTAERLIETWKEEA